MAASAPPRVAVAVLICALLCTFSLPLAIALPAAPSSIPLYPLPYGAGYTLTAGAGGPAGWQDVSLMLLSTASGEIIFRTRDGCSSSSGDPGFANGCLGEDMADGSVGTPVRWSIAADDYRVICAEGSVAQGCMQYDLRLGLSPSPGVRH